jgi:hypothetical protein
LWGVRPRRAGLRCRDGAEQAVQGGSRGLFPDPTGGLPPHPASTPGLSESAGL